MAKPNVQVQDPPIVTRPLTLEEYVGYSPQREREDPPHNPVHDPRYVLPAGKKFPEYHLKLRREPMPCQKCRRIRQNDGGQAVACSSSGADVSWFHCKCCGHKFSMPVKVM